MSDPRIRVTFQPCGRLGFDLPGTRLFEAAARAGLAIDMPCGGPGTCGECCVQTVSGDGEPTEAHPERGDPAK